MTWPAQKDVLLLTQRCQLRAPERRDYKAWSFGRAVSRRHLEPWEPLWPSDALSREDWVLRLSAWRAGWRQDRAYVFLIFARNGTELYGGASITNVRRGPAQSGVVGYWLLKSATGSGLMTECLSRVCEWAHNDLGLQRLEAATLPENTRSQAVLRRCQFEPEGRATAYLEINGARRDHLLYGRTWPEETQ